MKTKPCIHCGEPLPEDASFCPVCGQSQITTEEVNPPRIWKRKTLYILLALAAVVLLIVAVIRIHLPKEYDNGSAEITYTVDGVTWHLLLRNASTQDPLHWTSPQGEYTRYVKKDLSAALPLQLNVYREDTKENGKDAFLPLLESSVVKAYPSGTSDVPSVNQPDINPAFPYAMQEADIVFNTDCNDVDLVWTLQMKNGDVIHLHEKMQILTLKEIIYSYTDTPLSTTEEVQALLDKLSTGIEPNSEVTIRLAPITYEGDLLMETPGITLQGSLSQTVLHGTLTTRFDASGMVNVQEITFSGNASDGEASSGVGIHVASSCLIESCTFENLTTGCLLDDGAGALPMGCSFTGCETAIHFCSSSSWISNLYCYQNTFVKNRTALLLEKVPTAGTVYVAECSFEENETDVDNKTTNEIEYM